MQESARIFLILYSVRICAQFFELILTQKKRKKSKKLTKWADFSLANHESIDS